VAVWLQAKVRDRGLGLLQLAYFNVWTSQHKADGYNKSYEKNFPFEK